MIADELGLEDIHASALITVGTARRNSGDPEGRSPIEEGLQIADRLNLPQVSFRAINNLSVSLVNDEGRLDRSSELVEDGLRRCERLGDRPQLIWFQSILAANRFWLGDFDDALRLVELVIDSAVPNYQTGNAHKLRARIRLARDDVAGAESDAEIAIALVRRIGEFQVVAPALAEASLVAAALGRESDALALVDELIELDRPRPVRARSTTTGFYVPFALAAVEVGRASEFLEVTANVEHPSPWLTAGRAYARGELGAAVELLSRLSVPDTAWARLRAARALVDESRRAEADAQLHRALAFYRSVGGTRYIREGEALLAATA